MKRLLLILLVFTACQKDPQTVLDGTYQVMSSNHFPGQVVISGNSIAFSGMGFGNATGTITKTGLTFIVNKGPELQTGNGQVHDDQIQGYVQIPYPGGISEFTYNGSK